MSRIVSLSLVTALLLTACGENAAINGPGVVDTSGSEDIAGDVTPTDDTSLPDAATSDTTSGCTFTSECPGAGDLCLAGKCVPQTVCASDKQCQASGQVCDTTAGICVTCLLDVDCAKGQSCKAHKCLEPAATCTTTKECATGMVCDKVLGACVECATAADCATGMACSQTVCVPMACKPGAAKCASTGSLATCAADGLGWTTSACGSGATCLVDACKSLICAPNQKSCDGQLKVMLCDATGTSLSQVDTCDPASNAKNVCLGGTCVPMACQAGSKVCADTVTLATCKADGTGYDNQPCGTGLACDGGACVATICKPLALACFNDTEVKQCNAAGTAESIATTCKTGEKCANGACVTAVCSPGSFSCAGATLSTCTSDGMGYSAKLCNDGDACTTDGCDTVKGCTTTALGCDDGNACTTDSCDKVKGCAHANAAGACEDNNPCTVGALCNAGGCGLPMFCDDNNPCTADSCSGGACSHTAIGNCCGADAACDDGNGCTTDMCALTCDGTAWNGSCYKGIAASNTWQTAEASCQSWGGHLASIGSANENTTVLNVGLGVCGAAVNNMLFGLNDIAKEGQYVWTDGSPMIFTNWFSGEPNDSQVDCPGKGEDGGDMHLFANGAGTWNDVCLTDALTCAVCEKPLPPGTCSHKPVASCCKVDKDCDDGDACTTDACVLGSPNKCTHTAVVGGNCCNPVVWFNDFESGDPMGTIANSLGVGKGWQVWSGSGKAVSGNSVLYYGDPAKANYDFGGVTSSGSWAFTPKLPTASKLTLTFSVYPAIESMDQAYDDLALSVVGTEIWTKTTGPLVMNIWNKVSVDVSKFQGQQLTFALLFDTIDMASNSTLGVLVDDVKITRSCP